MDINKVAVLGGQGLGSQIAFQIAYSGFPTVIYEASEIGRQSAADELAKLPEKYECILNAEVFELVATKRRIQVTVQLSTALQGADVVLDALPGDLQTKQNLYRKIGSLLKPTTLLLSTSESIRPSQLILASNRPLRLVAMHFADHLWQHNSAEIMWAKNTPQATIDDAVDFALLIHMLPIQIPIENDDYVMDSFLEPMITTALMMWAIKGVDPIAIDQDWMVNTGADRGPFGVIDQKGIQHVIVVEKQRYNETKDARYLTIVKRLTDDYQNQGKLGVESGVGFYEYPHPAYEQPEFLLA